MTQSNECPCGRARAGCEYHDPDLQAPTEWNAMPPEAKAQYVDAGLKLLGPDDPEVSSDLIYRDEATGGLVSVLNMRACIKVVL